MLNLNQLRHLIALDEERHFARAAAKVHLSQPAFSRSIQSIERQLEMQLFDRQGGQVRPTPGGAFVLARASQLLFDARCVERDVALYRDSRLGDTAFGVGPFPAATLVERLLRQVRHEHPEVKLRIEVSNWATLLERLQREDIEFFVVDLRAVPITPALEAIPLMRQEGGFFVRKDHPLGNEVHALADVWRYGVASARITGVINVALAKALGLPEGEIPPLALECDDIHLLIRSALNTDTVVAATDLAIQMHAEPGALRRLQIAGLPVLFVDIGLVRLRQRTPSPMAQRLLEILRQQVQALAPAAPKRSRTTKG